MSSHPAPSLPVQCLTLNHRTAPAALREQVALSGETLSATLRSARQDYGIDRLVILSTCQRIELYSACASDVDARERLTHWLSSITGVAATTLAEHTEYFEGIAVARHLCHVAAGLDATLLGEAQILSQVASAIRTAVAVHAASPVLKALFRTAVRAGERARGAVWSAYPRTDVGSVAADVATATLGGLENKHGVVIGAGSVGELAVRALRAHGITSLALINRTIAHAESLAARYGATAYSRDAIPAMLRDADVIVVATSAPTYILDRSTFAEVRDVRATRPVVIIDAAMPRNVDPDIRVIPGVRLIDLEELTPAMSRAHEERTSAIPAVEAIIDEAVAALAAQYVASARTPARHTPVPHTSPHHTTPATRACAMPT